MLELQKKHRNHHTDQPIVINNFPPKRSSGHLAEVKKGWTVSNRSTDFYVLRLNTPKQFFFNAGGVNLLSDIIFGCPENIVLKCWKLLPIQPSPSYSQFHQYLPLSMSDTSSWSWKEQCLLEASCSIPLANIPLLCYRDQKYGKTQKEDSLMDKIHIVISIT